MNTVQGKLGAALEEICILGTASFEAVALPGQAGDATPTQGTKQG